MKRYTIYKHTSPSNKVYIGITCQNIERRWRNGNGYKNQKYFYRAIEKYGWDNFIHEILYEGLEKEQAKVLEISLIYYYNSSNPDFGYNLTKGGEGHFGYSPSEETRQKLSESHKGEKNYWYGKNPWDYKTEEEKREIRRKISEAGKGRIVTKETKNKIGMANKGSKRTEEERKKISEKAKERYSTKENNPMYGKNHTEESKRKMSEAKKGRYTGEDNWKSKKVICVTTMRIFDSINQGAIFYGIKNSTNISKCCKGKTNYCGKLLNGEPLIWKYLIIIEL